MGLGDQGAIIQPNVGQLVAPAAAVVEPNSTAMLTDAFRKGFITADDVLERVGEKKRATDKLATVQAKNALALEENPDVQAARVLQVTAAKQKAEGDIALQPLLQKQKENEAYAAIFKAQAAPGNYDAMLDALAKNGYPVTIDPQKGLTEENRKEAEQRFSKLIDYSQKKMRAEENAKGIKSEMHPSADGKQLLPVNTFQGRPIDEKEHKAILQTAAAFQRTPFSIWANLPDGEVQVQPKVQPSVAVQAAPMVEPASPEVAAQIRASLVNRGVPGAAGMSDAQVTQQQWSAPVVQAVVPAAAPTTAPVVEVKGMTPGAITPQGGVYLGEKPTEAHKMMTGEQQKQLAMQLATADQFVKLKDAHENMMREAPYGSGPVYGPVASAVGASRWNKPIAGFEQAKTAVLPGLAKGIYFETGVLSDKDIERYQATLPSRSDTDSVARLKLSQATQDVYRAIINNILTQELQGVVSDPKKQAIFEHAQARLKELQSSVRAVFAPPAAKAYVVGGRKLARDASGNVVVVP